MPDNDSEKIREIRHAVLRNRYLRQGCAQTAQTIAASVRLDNRRITDEDVFAAIDYLEKKGFLKATRDHVAAGVVYWDITAEGIDAYES